MMDAYDLARDWISDCLWGEMDEEDVIDLTNEQVRRGVERHYHGGWTSFLEDAGLTLDLAPAGPRSRPSMLAG